MKNCVKCLLFKYKMPPNVCESIQNQESISYFEMVRMAESASSNKSNKLFTANKLITFFFPVSHQTR